MYCDQAQGRPPSGNTMKNTLCLQCSNIYSPFLSTFGQPLSTALIRLAGSTVSGPDGPNHCFYEWYKRISSYYSLLVHQWEDCYKNNARRMRQSIVLRKAECTPKLFYIGLLMVCRSWHSIQAARHCCVCSLLSNVSWRLGLSRKLSVSTFKKQIQFFTETEIFLH